MHQRTKHGSDKLLSRVAADSTCPVCSTDMRTRVRLLTHLKQGPLKCRMTAAMGMIPIATTEQVEQYRKADASERRQHRSEGVHDAFARLPANMPLMALIADSPSSFHCGRREGRSLRRSRSTSESCYSHIVPAVANLPFASEAFSVSACVHLEFCAREHKVLAVRVLAAMFFLRARVPPTGQSQECSKD